MRQSLLDMEFILVSVFPAYLVLEHRTNIRRLIATVEVKEYRLQYEGINFVLVDTPGFDDTNISDQTILQKIIEWLTKCYQKGRKLNGILYLHRITDPRMQGTALRNFRIFRSLCGDDFYSHVILGISFWYVLEKTPGGAAIGQKRLDQLVGDYEFWGSMIQKGSRVQRIPKTAKEAKQLLLKFADFNEATLRVQDEMLNQSLPQEWTAAVQATRDEKSVELQRAHILAKEAIEGAYVARMQSVEGQWAEFLRYTEEKHKQILLQQEKERKRELEKQRQLREEQNRQEEAARQQLQQLAHEQQEMQQRKTQMEREAAFAQWQLQKRGLDNQINFLMMKLAAGIASGTVKCKISEDLGTPNYCDCCFSMLSGTGHYSKLK